MDYPPFTPRQNLASVQISQCAATCLNYGYAAAVGRVLDSAQTLQE